MILHKLTMKNFRQFRGIQSIEFASRMGDSGKNVTVIFGENGRGKTGIFRAIMFCLYGDHRLSQDEEVEEKELYLVNLAELRNADANDRYPVESFVELEFSHKRERYVLKRIIYGMLDRDKVIEEHGEVGLARWKTDGNCITYDDPRDVESIVNAILDRRVKEYFLFDGEKIERLTRANAEQRMEISKGIRNLLNVDALEKAIRATERLRKSLDDELTKKSTGEFGKILNQLNVCEENRRDLKNRLDQLDVELKHASEEKRKVDKELEKFSEIRHLLKERNELENALEDYQEAAKKLLEEMKNRVGKAALLLVKETIEKVFKAIDERKQKGEIPSEIRKDLIERILLEKKCICGREVLVGTPAFDEIIQWKNRTHDISLQDSALDLWRYLSGIRNRNDDLAETLETLLQRYGVNKNKIEKVCLRIDDINKEIGSSERQDAAKLEDHRGYLESRLRKMEVERLSIQRDLESVNQEYEKLQAQRAAKEQEENIKNELSERAALANKSLEALRAVYNEFTTEIKDVIGKTATEFFKKLLDKESQETLRHIVVDNSYALQVLDR